MKLSEKLAALVNGWGDLPDGSAIPNVGLARGELTSFISIAKDLEDSQTSADADALIEKLEAQSKDNGLLLAAMKKEIKALRKEQAERSKAEQYPNIPREQFWILEILPVESQGTIEISEIADRADIPLNEVELHLDKLAALEPKLAHHTYNQPIYRRWFCTIAGTQFLLSVRADESKLRKFRRSRRLGDLDDRILRLLAYGPRDAMNIDCALNGGVSSFAKAQRMEETLESLKSQSYVEKDGSLWKSTARGINYVSEHRGSR